MNNALRFALTVGCGTSGKNSTSENLSSRHFVKKTALVEPSDKTLLAPEIAFGSVLEPELENV